MLQIIQLRQRKSAIAVKLARILFYFALSSFVFSYSYFPLRLYFTGIYTPAIVQSKEYLIHSTRNGPLIFHYFTTINKEGKYFVDPLTFEKIEEGDTINVFFSEEIKKGIYSDRANADPITILIAYDPYALISILLVAVALILIVRDTILHLILLLNRIKKDVRKEIASTNKPSIKWVSYGKAYTSFLTATAFSYAFALLIVKAVYSTEHLIPIIAGCIIYVGIITSIRIPYFLYSARIYLKSLRQKTVSYTLQIAGLIFGVYSTYKLFAFVSDNSSFQDKSIVKLLIDLLKALLP